MSKPSTAPLARTDSQEVRPYADDKNASRPVWKAVLAGLAVDLGSSTLLFVVPAMGYGFFLASSGVPREEAYAALVSIAFNPWFFVPATLLGLALSGLGGYVCARMAGGAALRAGVILAVLTVALGLLFAGDPLIPLWVHGLLVVLTAAAVMLGVRLGSASHR